MTPPEGTDPTPPADPAPPPAPPAAPPTIDELVADVKTKRDAFNAALAQRLAADTAVADATAVQVSKRSAESDALTAKDAAIDNLIAELLTEK